MREGDKMIMLGEREEKRGRRREEEEGRREQW